MNKKRKLALIKKKYNDDNYQEKIIALSFFILFSFFQWHF